MTKRRGLGGARWAVASRVAMLAVATFALVGVARAATSAQESAFPHDRHEGLFPLCAGCHEGVPDNDPNRFYPSVEQCNLCHVGDQERVDTWTDEEPEPDNLKFQHGFHEALFGDFAPTCEGCHSAPEGPRMAVSGDVQLGTCWTCHQATEHQVDAPCATCHIPLAETQLPVARISRFPFPADHASPVWLTEQHGADAADGTARCATCHTADRCVACHVDTDREEIAEMLAAPEGMELPPTYARYVAPASHEDQAWLGEHRIEASRAECGTCHTSDSCMACHVQPAPTPVASLTSRDEAVAPGVEVVRRGPESHESYFFLDTHWALAASEGVSCATCHAESFCVECHDGPSSGGYHPPQFVARHQAEAFGRDAECATCHNTQAFCRSCHVEVGLTSFGRLGPGYHDAQSVWLLRHGQAARQNLESCASCHAQSDCTQCHGVLGAFKVNPHSASFDAQSAWARSPQTCLACHIGNPIGENDL